MHHIISNQYDLVWLFDLISSLFFCSSKLNSILYGPFHLFSCFHFQLSNHTNRSYIDFDLKPHSYINAIELRVTQNIRISSLRTYNINLKTHLIAYLKSFEMNIEITHISISVSAIRCELSCSIDTHPVPKMMIFFRAKANLF